MRKNEPLRFWKGAIAMDQRITRRGFAGLATASVAALRGQTKSRFPVGLQQTAVGRNIQQDLTGTLRAISKMGYEVIEFSAGTFMKWSPEEAKQVREQPAILERF
jgi:hypothetical protein